MRQAIHTLRDRLEPARRAASRPPTSSRAAAATSSRRAAWIDADDFEAPPPPGLAGAPAGRPSAPSRRSPRGGAYRGDFLADEPYAEWALAERERLRDLAGQVLRGLAGIRAPPATPRGRPSTCSGSPSSSRSTSRPSASCSRLLLSRGRHSEALRRYEILRRRYKRTFGGRAPRSARRRVTRPWRLPAQLLAAVLALPPRSRGGCRTSSAASEPAPPAARRAAGLGRRSALVILFVAAAGRADRARHRRDGCGRRRSAALGMLGLVAFYRALAIGTMSIVAPISATGVAIPVLVGLASGERPSALQVAGIVLAVRRACLAAREAPGGTRRRGARAGRDRARAARRDRVRLVLRRDRPGGGDRRRRLGPAGRARRRRAARGAAIVRPRVPRALGRSLRSARSTCSPTSCSCSAGRGLLSVVGVLGSLYPAVTVVLARFVLHERLSRARTPGVPITLAGGDRARRGIERTRNRGPGAGCAGPLARCADSSPSSRCLLALLAASGAASASPLQPGDDFEAPAELLDDARASRRWTRSRRMGVTAVRALVYWQPVHGAAEVEEARQAFDTPTRTRTPRAPGTARPARRSTHAARIRSQLTLTGRCRSGRPSASAGTSTIPARKLFGRWARAVAPRYGDRVDLWSIWNEPNHPEFLGPQYKHDKPHTPKLYRKLYAAGERAIHRARATSATRCCSARPRRSATRTSSRRSLPARRAVPEPSDYKAKGVQELRIDGYAHHAYTRKDGPTFVSDDADEVSIGSLGA